MIIDFKKAKHIKNAIDEFEKTVDFLNREHFNTPAQCECGSTYFKIFGNEQEVKFECLECDCIYFFTAT